MFFLLSPEAVLWFVLGTTATFVVAPHLEVASKAAGRTLRIGGIVAVLQLVVPFIFMFARADLELSGYVRPVFAIVFFGSFALAAWQLIQEAPPKKGGLS